MGVGVVATGSNTGDLNISGTLVVPGAGTFAATAGQYIVFFAHMSAVSDLTSQTVTDSIEGAVTANSRLQRSSAESNVPSHVECFTWKVNTTGNRTITFARNGTDGGNAAKVVRIVYYVLSGVDVDGTAFDTVGANNENSSTTNDLTTTALTPGESGKLFVGVNNGTGGGVGYTSLDLTISQDQLAEDYPAGTEDYLTGYKDCTSGVSTGGANLDAQGSGAVTQNWIQIIVRQSPTMEQEGFRWRDDDGSETTASWLASQDTGITRAANTNTRLRMLLDAAGDPASTAWTLQYRRTGPPNYPWTTINSSTGDIQLSASANIAASGEATTGQLTAPASGSFAAGRMQDDENPADAINLASNEYTEIEWCLKAVPGTWQAQPTFSFEFRVVQSTGTVLDTYSVTPTWTITGGRHLFGGQH